MTAVIVTGGIDLSVGSVLALSMMVMGWVRQSFGVPLPIGIVFALITGGACGLVNGLLVTRAKLPWQVHPFVYHRGTYPAGLRYDAVGGAPLRPQ
jgi:ribose/xylose/arabinose/galactoside ABC-type transport system permease subunit